MPRIVTLIASATEIVCALGFEDQIVGRSHECDYPESVKRLPVCTEPKFDPDGTSYEIDQRVKAIVQEGLSVYRVDGEKLRELEPDVIVTQSHCEVCAVSLRDVERAVCAWLRGCPQLVSLAPNALADVWTSIEQVADALEVPERGAEVIRRLQARMRAIARRTRRLRPSANRGLYRVDRSFDGGRQLDAGDGRDGRRRQRVRRRPAQHSPWMTGEQLCTVDPDILILLPCGFDIARTRRDLPVLTNRPEWTRLRAVQTRRVFLADGNQYFNRPGPRLVESLEILAELLHPEVFAFGHEGTGWQRV